MILHALSAALVFACAGICSVAIVNMLYPNPERAHLHPAIPVAALTVTGTMLAVHGARDWQIAVIALLGIAFTGSWYADARAARIPDWFTLAGIAVAIAVAFWHYGGVAAQALGWGLFIFIAFGLSVHMSRGRGMSWGDAKLAALAGIIFGPLSLLVLGAACFTATVVAVVRDRGTQPIAFAPYIAFGTLAALAIRG
jgi:prepilin signal peptidase PulO-like enzyme (type II secretory pathway)